MIVATAGHVDHGKTSLLKALTGVDADRLPEEKKRGLTIDLGFAYSDRILPGTVIGFVDVPGHERFIHNMLAGVTAIRAAMLVVAADDGPMPQTREHLDILDLVGVETGLVAVTKVDRVGAERVAEVAAEVTGMLAGTSLAGADVFPVSAITGQGVEALAAHLADLSQRPDAAPEGNFRLPIDRVFTVEGAGMVVTGLVRAGRVRVGDTVRVLPGGRELRVRGLRAQDRPAEVARQGDRAAVNLAGAARKDDIGRGDWLVAGPAQAASRRLDARIRLLPSEAVALKHWAPVHVHVGTADVTGRVALLEDEAIRPGAAGLVQLVLDQPVHAAAGDAVVLRDQSARRTMAGGRVLDPASPARGRARAERLAWVRALAGDDRAETVATILRDHPQGAPLHALAAAWNLTEAEADALFGAADRLCRTDGVLIGFTGEHWARLEADILAALEAHHRARPDLPGMNEAALGRALATRVHEAALADAVGELVRRGAVRRAGPALQRAGFETRLAEADARLWRRAEAIMAAAAEKPPTIFELAQELGLDQQAVARLLARVAKLGHALRVSDNRYMTMATLRRLADVAATGAASRPGGRFTAADYRDWSGMGRNLSIEILEFFDRMSFTRRHGNERVVLRSVADVFGAGADTEGAPA